MAKHRATNERPAFKGSSNTKGEKDTLWRDIKIILIKTIGATAAASTLFNVFGGKSPIHYDIKPTPPTTSTTETHEPVPDDSLRGGKVVLTAEQNTEHQRQEFAPDFIASSLGPEHEKVMLDYTERLVQLLESDPSAEVSIVIHGLASDESSVDSVNHDANLGAVSGHNSDLASARGILAEESLNHFLSEHEGLRGRISVTTVPGKEVVLNESQLASVNEIASRKGLSVEQLIAQYNSDKSGLGLSDSDQESLERMFDANRGAVLETTIKRTVVGADGNPCDLYLRQVVVKEEYVKPGRDGLRIDIVPFFIPPLRLRRAKHKKNKKSEKQATAKESADIVENPSEEQDAATVSRSSGSESTRSLPDVDLSRLVNSLDLHRDWKKIAALVAAGAVLFLPWADKSSQGGGVTNSELTCTSAEVTYPSFTKLRVWFPVIETVANALGHPVDTSLEFTSGEAGSTKTTIKPHSVYIFDENGKLIDVVEKPEETVGYYTPSDNPSERWSRHQETLSDDDRPYSSLFG